MINQNETKHEQRFDVFVVSISGNKIVSKVGADLTENQADRREMTALMRINDNYYVSIDPAGKYKEGDIRK